MSDSPFGGTPQTSLLRHEYLPESSVNAELASSFPFSFPPSFPGSPSDSLEVSGSYFLFGDVRNHFAAQTTIDQPPAGDIPNVSECVRAAGPNIQTHTADAFHLPDHNVHGVPSASPIPTFSPSVDFVCTPTRVVAQWSGVFPSSLSRGQSAPVPHPQNASSWEWQATFPSWRPMDLPSNGTTSRQSSLDGSISPSSSTPPPALSPVLSDHPDFWYINPAAPYGGPALPSMERRRSIQAHPATPWRSTAEPSEFSSGTSDGYYHPDIDGTFVNRNVPESQPGASLFIPYETACSACSDSSLDPRDIPIAPIPPTPATTISLLQGSVPYSRGKKRKATLTRPLEDAPQYDPPQSDGGDETILLPVLARLRDLRRHVPGLGAQRTWTIINNSSQTTSSSGEITYYDPRDELALPIPSGSRLALYNDSGDENSHARYTCTYICPVSGKMCSKPYKNVHNWERHFTTHHVKNEYKALQAGTLTDGQTISLKHPHAAVQTVKCSFSGCTWQSKVGDRPDMPVLRHLRKHKPSAQGEFGPDSLSRRRQKKHPHKKARLAAPAA